MNEITVGGESNGSGLRGYFNCSYMDLVRTFGPSEDCDDHFDGKVSTRWVLTFRDQVFTLYDYKETNLYDPRLASTKTFRSRLGYDWHIGSPESSNVEAFKESLRQQIEGV